jgi:hypothetical protein
MELITLTPDLARPSAINLSILITSKSAFAKLKEGLDSTTTQSA